MPPDLLMNHRRPSVPTLNLLKTPLDGDGAAGSPVGGAGGGGRRWWGGAAAGDDEDLEPSKSRPIRLDVALMEDIELSLSPNCLNCFSGGGSGGNGGVLDSAAAGGLSAAAERPWWPHTPSRGPISANTPTILQWLEVAEQSALEADEGRRHRGALSTDATSSAHAATASTETPARGFNGVVALAEAAEDGSCPVQKRPLSPPGFGGNAVAMTKPPAALGEECCLQCVAILQEEIFPLNQTESN